MDGPRKQPPSYVDYMNDVFEASLPNEPEIDRKLPLEYKSDSGKHSYYKGKWLEIKNALDDNVIVRVNHVDFGINWKILAKLEPALESCQVTAKQQLEDGTKVFSVNRNVSSFVAILDFYRNGQLHMPPDVCPNVFKRELEFWRVDFREMSQCCLRKYANFHDDEQTLTSFEQAFNTKPDGRLFDAKKSCPSKWAKVQACGWAILSDPSSSIWAKLYLGVASFFVVLSIFLLAASTNRTFLRELDASEWEEFMSSQELDYYYELIYKRPKPSPGSQSDSSQNSDNSEFDDATDLTLTTESSTNGGTGPGNHKIGKRSILNTAYDAMVDIERHSDERPNRYPAPGRNSQYRRKHDALVNPIDLDSISENHDVRGEGEPNSEATERKQGAKIRTDLQSLLESVLTSVLEEASRRMKINGQNLPRGGYVHAVANESGDRSKSNHPDMEGIHGKENNGKLNHAIHRQKEDQADDYNPVRHIQRFKRSSPSDENQNSTQMGNQNMTFQCIYMDEEALNDAVARLTATAVSFMSPSTVQLPSAYNVYNWARYLEMICIVFFALEFFIRFLFAPSKTRHLLSFFTIIDFVALVTMLTTVLIDTLNPKEKYTTSVVDAINCFQVVRVFRFFRLMKNVIGFRVLVFSIRSSWRELLLLVLYIVMAVTIFSTMIYYCEKENMKSIPDACWWAIVTMTTVGYGDMTPKTLSGKLIGVGCALSGVLLIAVTVPVFVNNFLLFYEHSKVIHYDKKRNADENLENRLTSDSTSEMSETTFVAESMDRENNTKQTVSRESSQSEWSTGKPRLKSELSISKVVPILISSKDGTHRDEKN